MRARSGAALLEVLVAALLGTIVTGAAVMLLHAQARIASNTGAHSERNETLRSALHVLRNELQPLLLARDVRSIGSDSVAARIMRGIAIVCGKESGQLRVRYRGLRLPDPSKDSVLQVGMENTAPLTSARTDSTACPTRAGETALVMAWPAEAAAGTVWLVFEAGSYHLNNYALRYRRGAESRQPITNEVINHTRSYFSADSSRHTIAVQLQIRDNQATARAFIPLLNRP